MKRPAFFYVLLIACPTFYMYAEQEQESTFAYKRLKDEQVHCVDFSFSDIHGNLKAVTCPMSQVSRAFKDGLCFDSSSIDGGLAITESDMILKPDFATLRIASDTKTARILCDVYKTETKSYDGDPRNLLKTVLEQARAMGFDFYVGPEIEFFIFKDDTTKMPYDQKRYFDAEQNSAMYAFKCQLLAALQEQGINVEKIHHEVAPGQLEISIKYGNALDIADQIILAKHVIASCAKKAGLRATFMPKPVFGQNGSGMHVHFSLYDIKNQRNAFYARNDAAYLSDTAKSFIAGILKYIPEISALLNSSVNSFKRIVPDCEAPIHICCGRLNRSALIRIPQFNADQSSAARAEIRSPDPLCNPYLVFAVLLAAGLEGIKNKEQLAPLVEENLYHLNKQQLKKLHIASLPTSFDEALKLLANSAFARTVLGDHLLTKFITIKEKELRDFNTAVTCWEINRYL